ncbi:molybdenum cofactor biosynthesis prote [Ceraceosorus guamensis]|uniref:GTP 3',8-cyclase n=1 Tax=Ceraceosorus guamensis TaxID=1522189 RepID=A0A316VTP9_9BASI|nr:molybdenum cofactor biosynthesis prote [Ceraceosorus guamensis]PWN40418.1 molybdenum cofactor biosynthesis prote [Ceraceosorus guamensis]
MAMARAKELRARARLNIERVDQRRREGRSPSSSSTTIRAIAPSAPAPAKGLMDAHNRHHTYLRISLTERCNLRCVYCMPFDGLDNLTPNDDLLSSEEIRRLAELFVRNGVDKIRLTGGEPSVRRDLSDIVASLQELAPLGLKQIGMTSNGLSLARQLPHLASNGLTHLNISLDTLQPETFESLTRRSSKGLHRVLDAIEQSLQLGIHTKVNVVVMGGVNDQQDVLDFVRWTKDKPITVRFIEYMPFSGNSWQATSLVPYKVLLQRIQAAFGPLERVQDDKNDTSKHWKVPGHRGRLGFITSMTDNFCGTCNRLRITADGNLKVCLFGNKEISLRDAMRHGILPSSSTDFATFASPSNSPQSASDEQLLDIINAALYKKHRKHAGLPSPDDIAKSDNRSMIRIAAQRSPHDASATSLSSGARPSGARALLVPITPMRASLLNRPPGPSAARPVPLWTSLPRPHGPLHARAFASCAASHRDQNKGEQVRSQPASSQHRSAAADASVDLDPWSTLDDAFERDSGLADTGSSRGSLSFSAPPKWPPTSSHCAADAHAPPAVSWSEYMGSNAADPTCNDSPWASLDAIADGISASDLRVPRPMRHVDGRAGSNANFEKIASRAHEPSSIERAMEMASPDMKVPAQQQAVSTRLQDASDDPRRAPAMSFATSGPRLTHIDSSDGHASARMVDISAKTPTHRSATASAKVSIPAWIVPLVRGQEHSHQQGSEVRMRRWKDKGPVLHTAQIAGIMAAKRTHDLIPLCHPIALTDVDVRLEIVETTSSDVSDDVLHAQRTDGLPGAPEEEEAWIAREVDSAHAFARSQSTAAAGRRDLGSSNFLKSRTHDADVAHILITCTARTNSATGVEMEALMGVNVAAMTIWDMLKSVAGRGMSIDEVRVCKKSGSKSGDWIRGDDR